MSNDTQTEQLDKFWLPVSDKQPSLFNNPIDTNRGFGIARKFTDTLNQLTSEITPETAKESYKYNNKTFKDKTGDLALRVIDDAGEIQTAEQFYTALARIKSGKVLQTLLALWNYANQRGNFVFNGVRLSKVMQTVLKKTGGYFTQPQKRDFTEAIQRLRDFEIYLDETITDTDERGRKKPVVKRDFYKLIDLVGATYAKRVKDFKDPETDRVVFKKGEADESVIIKLYGELLPRFNKGIMQGRLYSRGLLELDANKDERAILLGFKLLTRFDQRRNWRPRSKRYGVADDNLFIKTDRKTLIAWADYTKTDLEDKWTANQQLMKTLNKLIEIKCLQSYQPRELTTNDDLQITLYPHPIAIQQEVLDQQKEQQQLSEPDNIKALLKKRVGSFGKTTTAEWLGYTVEELETVLSGRVAISKEAEVKLLSDY